MADKDGIEAIMEAVASLVCSQLYLSLFVLVFIPFAIFRAWLSRPNSQASSEPLKISEIYIYPIKSLRGTRVPKAVATKHGFEHDRTFMLLKVTDEGLKNMAVARYYEMTQFLTDIQYPTESNKHRGTITVTYASPKGPKVAPLEIPLEPNTDGLETFEVTMHGSSTPAFKMPSSYSDWFSKCFGYEVVFAYLGPNRRDVLFEDLKPRPNPSSLLSKISGKEPYNITFADCAPYLIVSRTSCEELSKRLPDGEEMDITKFRPNIVVTGAKRPWEEDYWGGLRIAGADLNLAHNCVRCRSINVDYATGEQAPGPAGEMLKKLQKDRRVDSGAKWSPVFGRYSYWDARSPSRTVKVGDDVQVTKINKERTTFTWPNLG